MADAAEVGGEALCGRLATVGFIEVAGLMGAADGSQGPRVAGSSVSVIPRHARSPLRSLDVVFRVGTDKVASIDCCRRICCWTGLGPTLSSSATLLARACVRPKPVMEKEKPEPPSREADTGREEVLAVAVAVVDTGSSEL